MGLMSLMCLIGKLCKRLVLSLLHVVSLFVCLVAETAEMQESVYDDAAEFLVEGDTEQLGIGPDSVEADVDVAA